MIRIQSFLLIPVHDNIYQNSCGTGHGVVDIESTAQSSCGRSFVGVPTPLLQDAGWEGCFFSREGL